MKSLIEYINESNNIEFVSDCSDTFPVRGVFKK